jgi:hypothetical protein
MPGSFSFKPTFSAAAMSAPTEFPTNAIRLPSTPISAPCSATHFWGDTSHVLPLDVGVRASQARQRSVVSSANGIGYRPTNEAALQFYGRTKTAGPVEGTTKNETPKKALGDRGRNGASIAKFRTRRRSHICEMPISHGLELTSPFVRWRPEWATEALNLRPASGFFPS